MVKVAIYNCNPTVRFFNSGGPSSHHWRWHQAHRQGRHDGQRGGLDDLGQRLGRSHDISSDADRQSPGESRHLSSFAVSMTDGRLRCQPGVTWGLITDADTREAKVRKRHSDLWDYLRLGNLLYSSWCCGGLSVRQEERFTRGSAVRHPTSGEDRPRAEEGGLAVASDQPKRWCHGAHVRRLGNISTVTLFVWKDQCFGLFCVALPFKLRCSITQNSLLFHPSVF